MQGVQSLTSTGKYSQTPISPFHENFSTETKKWRKIVKPLYAWFFDTRNFQTQQKAPSRYFWRQKDYNVFCHTRPLLRLIKKFARDKWTAPETPDTSEKKKRSPLITFPYCETSFRTFAGVTHLWLIKAFEQDRSIDMDEFSACCSVRPQTFQKENGYFRCVVLFPLPDFAKATQTSRYRFSSLLYKTNMRRDRK